MWHSLCTFYRRLAGRKNKCCLIQNFLPYPLSEPNLCVFRMLSTSAFVNKQLTPTLFLLYLGGTFCSHNFWKKQFWGFHVITSREREIYMDMIRELLKESDFWLCHETLKFKKRFPLGGGEGWVESA